MRTTVREHQWFIRYLQFCMHEISVPILLLLQSPTEHLYRQLYSGTKVLRRWQSACSAFALWTTEVKRPLLTETSVRPMSYADWLFCGAFDRYWNRVDFISCLAQLDVNGRTMLVCLPAGILLGPSSVHVFKNTFLNSRFSTFWVKLKRGSRSHFYNFVTKRYLWMFFTDIDPLSLYQGTDFCHFRLLETIIHFGLRTKLTMFTAPLMLYKVDTFDLLMDNSHTSTLGTPLPILPSMTRITWF